MWHFIQLLISVVLGGYMAFDGLHVLRKGKYFGPEEPGPWAALFRMAGIDPFRLGYLFVAYGIAWLALAYGLACEQAWTPAFSMVLSLATLWYVPVGTLLCLVMLAGGWWLG